MSIKILPIKVMSRPRPVGFITVKDRTLTPLAERFIDCARKVTMTSKVIAELNVLSLTDGAASAPSVLKILGETVLMTNKKSHPPWWLCRLEARII